MCKKININACKFYHSKHFIPQKVNKINLLLLFEQEPANYDFAYKVNDYMSGSDFGHQESRQDNRAEGTYFVVLPDGTKQVSNTTV